MREKRNKRKREKEIRREGEVWRERRKGHIKGVRK